MKKSLIMLGAGACVLLAFPSCQSSKTTADGGYETATMASDTIADGEIPPWLLEDDSDVQVDAGARTPSRTSYAIPEPEPTVADTGSGSSSSRQNQPELAQNDVNIETPATDVPTFTPPPAEPAPSVSSPPSPSRTSVASSQPKKTGASKTSSKGTSKGAKKGRRYEKPTMLTYTVRKGDNLSDIAKRSRTTVAQIKKDSGLKGNTIYPGQTIKVRYTPKNYKPGKTTAKGSTAKAKGKNHIVAKGQTISGIAKQYGVPYGQILKANNLTAEDAAKIRPGKRLVIPGKSTSTSKASAKKGTSSKAKRTTKSRR